MGSSKNNNGSSSLSSSANNWSRHYGSIETRRVAVASSSNGNTQQDEDGDLSVTKGGGKTLATTMHRRHNTQNQEYDDIIPVHVGRTRRGLPTRCLVLTSVVASATSIVLVIFLTYLSRQAPATYTVFPSAGFNLPMDDDVPEWTRAEFINTPATEKSRSKKATQLAQEALAQLNNAMQKDTEVVNANTKVIMYGTAKQETSKKKQREKEAAPEGCESTVMVMRHCEKDYSVSESHCNYVGFERAAFLPSLFGGDLSPDVAASSLEEEPTGNSTLEPSPAGPGLSVISTQDQQHIDPPQQTQARWPKPSYLYALSQERHKHPVYREIETIQPLADKYNLTINSHYSIDHTENLVDELFSLLQSGTACGKLVLICWKHSEIPHLVQSLGCGPMQGCPMDYQAMEYDEVWQLKFVYHKLGLNLFGFPPQMSYHQEEDENDKKKRKKKKEKKKTTSRKNMETRPEWRVSGSVQYQGFDPLGFSNQVGDYPSGGVGQGGRWIRRVEYQQP